MQRQEGILRRIPVKDGEDGFADAVLVEDDAAIRRVVEGEHNSEVCAAGPCPVGTVGRQRPVP